MSETTITQDDIIRGQAFIKPEDSEIMLAVNKHLIIKPEDTAIDIRRKIKTLEYAMRKLIQIFDLPPIDAPVKHLFIKGQYIREWFGPAGTLTVGKIHKKEHVLFIMKGECVIVSEVYGVKYHIAPDIVSFPAGSQKVVLARTDTIIAGALNTDETDLVKIEKEFTAENYTEVGKEDPIIDECFINLTAKDMLEK